MNTEWAAVVWGLLAAISWGTGDYAGALGSRRMHTVLVTLLNQIVGVVLFIGLALIFGEALPSIQYLGMALLAGLAGGAGIVALFRAMAIGQMGIASPVSAVLTAAIPVVFAAFFQGIPGLLQFVGFALALGGVWIVSRPDGSDQHSNVMGLAVLSSLGFATFKILFGLIPVGTVFWPLAVAKIGGLIVGLLMIGGVKPKPRLISSALGLAAVSGLADAVGNTFFLFSAQTQQLGVAAVVSALYPAFTTVLAWLLLREKLSRVQVLGMALMLIAIPLIAQK